jgi:hypothetical protein
MLKVYANTPVIIVIRAANEEFGVTINEAQAQQIKDSLKSRVGAWKGGRYITTRGTDQIQRMDSNGVHYSAYGTYYKRAEWNKAMKDNVFA